MTGSTPLVQAATNGEGGSAGVYVLAGTLLAIVVGAVVWYMLNQQSAAISRHSIALASGASAHGMASSGLKKRNNAVVIAGPMGSGKTALWTMLRFPGSAIKPQTQTSMSVNAAEASVNESRVYLVDVPGHQKYRLDRDSYLPMARGIVFVVDSIRIAETIRPAAELLYDILANGKVQAHETPLLLLCNKQDDPAALSNARVQALLEDEIDRLRTTRQAGLDSLRTAHLAGASGASGGAAAAGDEDDLAADERSSDFLGYEGKKFSFEHLPNSVQVSESSLVLGHDVGGLEHIERWISDTVNS